MRIETNVYFAYAVCTLDSKFILHHNSGLIYESEEEAKGECLDLAYEELVEMGYSAESGVAIEVNCEEITVEVCFDIEGLSVASP